MKKLTLLVGASLLALSITACGGSDGSAASQDSTASASGAASSEGETAGAKYLSEIKATDYVTLGDYKGVTVDAEKLEVTDAEIEDYINYVLNSKAEVKPVEGRDVVEKEDIANIDYEGKKDGVAFEGGTAKGYDLGIGTGTFIPGFEDALIGVKVGETVDIPLTFPEGYSDELGGQDVIFTVTVNSIGRRVVPELTEELLKEIDPDVSSIDEYKEKLKNDLLESKKESREDTIINELQQIVQNNATFGDKPQAFADRIYDSMISSLEEMAAAYNMEPAQVAQYIYHVTGDNYKDELRKYSDDTIVSAYILIDAIAETEGIEVTDEDVDKDVQEMIAQYGSEVTLEEFKKDKDQYESRREYLTMMKVLDFLRENAVINEK